MPKSWHQRGKLNWKLISDPRILCWMSESEGAPTLRRSIKRWTPGMLFTFIPVAKIKHKFVPNKPFRNQTPFVVNEAKLSVELHWPIFQDSNCISLNEWRKMFEFRFIGDFNASLEKANFKFFMFWVQST